MNRRGLWVLAILVAVLAVAYVGAARTSGGPPLDPTSTAPDGAKAVVELVDRLGGDLPVLEGAPDAAVDVALLLEDRLPREQADAVTDWVRDGGVLVVADPSSLFTPPVGEAVVDDLAGSCSYAPLAGVAVLDVGVSRGYEVPAGADGCFRTPAGDAFVVVAPQGEGRVLSIGGPAVFTNALLDEDDNAVLAATLLARDGQRSVFLRPTLAGSGDRSLVDLVETPARAALAQLVVVFVAVVAWRARRLGRPVEEPQPVQIQGSELTRAVGRLLQSNRRPERAAAVLRDRARRDLSGPLGLALDAPADVVVSTIATRTGLTEADARRAVADPVTSDERLVEVAQLLSRIREEIIHDRSAVHRR